MDPCKEGLHQIKPLVGIRLGHKIETDIRMMILFLNRVYGQ